MVGHWAPQRREGTERDNTLFNSGEGGQKQFLSVHHIHPAFNLYETDKLSQSGDYLMNRKS